MNSLLTRLRRAIGCPIRWHEFLTDKILVHDLRVYWVEVASSYQTDGEMRYYSAMDFAIMGDAVGIDAIEHNTSIWRPRAIAEYERRVGFLINLRFKPASERSKHRTYQKLSREEVISMAEKESFFFSDVSERRLCNLMWAGTAQCWKTLAESRSRHFFVESQIEIGASERYPTRIVRFDVDYSNSEVHAHPRRASDPGEEVYHEEGGSTYASEYDDSGWFDETLDDLPADADRG